MEKICNFKDLNAWKLAHQLVVEVYRMSKHFPADEKFALTDQIRRCAISITSNIAEGFGRSTSRDKIQFYAISRGSIYELESQLLIARDLGYLRSDEYDQIEQKLTVVGKLIGGLIKTAPSRY